MVDQDRVVTAGGATSFLNLALYIVERVLGAEAAPAASRMFLVHVNKGPQTAYAMFATQRTHGDEDVLRAQGIIESELATSLSVGELARRVAMSRRNFVRRFKRATGNAPLEYIGRVRVEAAKRALERSRRPIAAIAADVGYDDVVAFRRLFARATGLTPSEYRARHGAHLTAPRGLTQDAGRLTILSEIGDGRVLIELAAALPEMIAEQLAGWGASTSSARTRCARASAESRVELAHRYGRGVPCGCAGRSALASPAVRLWLLGPYGSTTCWTTRRRPPRLRRPRRGGGVRSRAPDGGLLAGHPRSRPMGAISACRGPGRCGCSWRPPRASG